MTIVSTPDTRNASSSSLSSSSFGHKMLTKMGWSSGEGLGKTKQGTKHHLRAVRREENLGIGAQTDTYGSGGWDETSKNFHGVLASLKEEHGGSSTPSSDDGEKKRKKKDSSSSSSKKKKKRMLEKQESGLTLARNKVTAGHARKMREAKDLGNKSREDMAAIFGVKVEQLPSSGTESSSATGAADGGDISAEETPNDAEQSSVSAPGDSASSDCSASSGEDKKAQKTKKKRKSEKKEKKDKKRKRSSGESKRPKKSRRE